MTAQLLLTTNPDRPDLLLLSSDQSDAQAVKEIASERSETMLLVVINDPRTLKTLGTQMASTNGTITCQRQTSAPEIPLNDTALILDPATIKALRLGILSPITPEVELTPKELNGAVDGPFMSALVKSWREAFRSVPNKHSIERLQFDMHCQGDRHEPRHIVRLLQEVSTVMSMKAKRNMDREVIFETMGCVDEEKRKWLQASLPGGNVS